MCQLSPNAANFIPSLSELQSNSSTSGGGNDSISSTDSGGNDSISSSGGGGNDSISSGGGGGNSGIGRDGSSGGDSSVGSSDIGDIRKSVGPLTATSDGVKRKYKRHRSHTGVCALSLII